MTLAKRFFTLRVSLPRLPRSSSSGASSSCEPSGAGAGASEISQSPRIPRLSSGTLEETHVERTEASQKKGPSLRFVSAFALSFAFFPPPSRQEKLHRGVYSPHTPPRAPNAAHTAAHAVEDTLVVTCPNATTFSSEREEPVGHAPVTR